MDLRCFIALELPRELKEAIDGETRELRSLGADVRWVPADNQHLTLKFLGRTPEELLPQIKEGLSVAASAYGPFRLVFKGFGAFPPTGRPRVIWIGLADSEELRGLHGDIEAALGRLGFEPEERAFSPHLMLGRVKSPKGMLALRKRIEASGEKRLGEMDARSVSLIRSELSPSGAKYTTLFSAVFEAGQ